MPAPEVSAFGDGSHAPGASGLTINGGGFGAFPGSAWIFENDDRSGDADELTVNDWNDIALDVDIPASLNNAAGTRYLRVQREDLAWSNALAFTLESGVVTLMPADLVQTEVLDAVALTQTHLLAAADIAQTEVLDGVALAQTHVLSVGDLAQVEALDGVGLIVEGTVAPIELAQLQLLGAVLLSQVHQVGVGELVQTQALDGPGLSVTHALSPTDIAQLLALEAIALQQSHVVAVIDIAQHQALEAAGGGQVGYLRASMIRIYPLLSGSVSVKPN